jgi:hypothetical protein
MNKQNIFECRSKNLAFSHIGGSTKRTGNLKSTFENTVNQWEQIFQVPPKKLAANSNKYNFSQHVSP